jgi:hypothetical protein
VYIKSQKDFWAGAMFMVFGVFAVSWAITHYHVGTPVDMGPGFMPVLVGLVLSGIGLAVLVRGLMIDGEKVPPFHWRSLILIPAVSAGYGYILESLGLVFATMLLVLVSRFAGKDFTWKEPLLLGAGLALFSVLVFVFGLAMPIPIWPNAFNGG